MKTHKDTLCVSKTPLNKHWFLTNSEWDCVVHAGVLAGGVTFELKEAIKLAVKQVSKLTNGCGKVPAGDDIFYNNWSVCSCHLVWILIFKSRKHELILVTNALPPCLSWTHGFNMYLVPLAQCYLGLNLKHRSVFPDWHVDPDPWHHVFRKYQT